VRHAENRELSRPRDLHGAAAHIERHVRAVAPAMRDSRVWHTDPGSWTRIHVGGLTLSRIAGQASIDLILGPEG
jgi:hypothetical protein